MVDYTQKAAEQLESEGIEVEILDPRTLKPLDEELIFSSVRKTHRVVIVEEANPFASISSEITFRIQQECFDDLDAPVMRVTTDDVPMPYNEPLEDLVKPSVEKIVAAIKRVTYVEN